MEAAEKHHVDDVLVVPMSPPAAPMRPQIELAYDERDALRRAQIDAHHEKVLAELKAAAERSVKKAPRMPRDTEPAHLIEVVMIVAGLLSLMVLTAGAIGWGVSEIYDAWRAVTWR